MRLTLRTLLAYLDDTLEPAQAKEIGQKVAESDTARELVERIKQVTRRRRLAAPQVSGPGTKLDPNTIAEYLDNAVSPETAAEVEAICLASDVHLAEVAACHQILTLVLGEPMSVPPTAKQRMYGLVKGPEAIPFRKPAPTKKEKEVEPAGPARDLDDTLRMGLPPVGAKSSLASKLLLFGGGFVAACLLLVAIWQVFNLSGGKKEDADKALVKVDEKDKSADKSADKAADKAADKDKEAKKDKTSDTGKDTIKDRDKSKEDPDKTRDKETDKDGKDEKKEDKKDDKKAESIHLVDYPLTEPDVKTVRPIGQYQTDEAKDSVVCLHETDMDWKRLTARQSEVVSGKALLSLPGSWSSIYLNAGLRLTLCGTMPEILGVPGVPLFECRVVPHHHDKLVLDLTLTRGQILLTNLKDRPQQVRIRFANPFDPARPEHYDVLLHGKGTEILVGLTSTYVDGEPFFPERKDQKRKGPVNSVICLVVKGFVNLKFGDAAFGMDALNLFQWDSINGPRGPLTVKDASFAQPELPLLGDEKLKAQLQSIRDAAKKARANFATWMENIDGKLAEGQSKARIKLQEAMQSLDPKERIDPKKASMTRVMLGRFVVRSMGALGDEKNIINLVELIDPPANDEIRAVARDSLVHWLAADRENDYVLYDFLVEKYRKVQAGRIMRLMHGLSKADLSSPATYQELIELLNSPNAIVRELASYRLYQAVPFAREMIPYSAAAPDDFRQEAQAVWRTITPPGSLPQMPKKKDK